MAKRDHILLRLPPDLAREFTDRAANKDISRNAEITWALTEFVSADAVVHLHEDNRAEVRGIGRKVMQDDPQLFPFHDATVPHESLGTDGAKRQRRYELKIGVIALMRKGLLQHRKEPENE